MDIKIKWFVYRISCLVTGRSYIGITKQTVHQRWLGHLSTAKRGSPVAMARAIRKYGKDKFSHEVLAVEYSFEEAGLTERRMIELHRTLYPNGYNLTTGGEAIWGRRVTEEARQRMSVSAKRRGGHPMPAEAKAALSLARSKTLLERPDLRRAIGDFNRGKLKSKQLRLPL